MRPSDPALASNRLLAALPAKALARLRPLLEPVVLAFKDKLALAGKPIDYVYFPFRGVMSLLVTTTKDEMIEVALVGNEGVVGVHADFGAVVSPFHVICQVPGDGVRMPLKTFQQELGRGKALATLSGRFLEGLVIQMAVTGACNRLHRIEQRCARWLLMTHDRVDGTEFLLTQEFLAKMLGIRRPGVSAVATSLKRNGSINYKRGKITVVDRPGLEAIACECYRTIKRAYERIDSSATPAV